MKQNKLRSITEDQKMPSSNQIKFHAPPIEILLSGTSPQPKFTTEELRTAKEIAFREGSDAATSSIERQMLEQRTDLLHLQSKTFHAVTQSQASLLEQIHALLPELLSESLKRILATTVIDRDAVLRIAHDLLNELTPSREQVEVQLSTHDLDLILGHEESFRERHPQILFRADPELSPGDCTIKSRFGIVDGRISTKIQTAVNFLK